MLGQTHAPGGAREGRDAGVSLLEILIAITLIGITFTAILVSLQVTTKASAIDRDHATSYAWLQAASDEIYRVPRVACDSAVDARAVYDIAAKNPVFVPDGWDLGHPVTDISVTSVEYLGRTSYDAPYEWDSTYCLEGTAYAGAEQYTQRITIQSVSPDGLVKTLQMVKGES